MINRERETLITLTEGSRHPILAGRTIAPSTLWRWRTRGVRGVRLEAYRIGGTVYTSVEALQRFLDRLNTDEGQSVPAVATAAPVPASDAKVLDAAGI